MNVIEQRVKVFLEAWKLRGGELDEIAFCQICGQPLVKERFGMVDGVLICIECKGNMEQVELQSDCELSHE